VPGEDSVAASCVAARCLVLESPDPETGERMAIVERLTQAEPDPSDYQRDLSISYSKDASAAAASNRARWSAPIRRK
jgi:hypothetical protein